MKKYENVKIEVLLLSQQEIIMVSNEGVYEEIIQDPGSWVD